MPKDTAMSEKKISIERTLDRLSGNRQLSIRVYLIALLLYFAAHIMTVVMARTQGQMLVIMGTPIPYSTFTGVFSSLGNICIIIMVVFFNKIGLLTSVLLLLLQLPMMIVNFAVQNSPNSIPGLFNNLLTLVAIFFIYLNNREIEKNQKRMRDQAVTDSLTSLPNRFACTELMNDLMRRGIPFSIVSVDLDNFKSINDTMGHEVGDKVLIEVANRWKYLADSWGSGTIDFVARLGGDEYAMIIRGYHSNKDLVNTLKTYQAELEKKITIDDCDYYMGACFGYAEYPADADNTGVLFSCADAAMHEVKRLGGSNRILHFTADQIRTERTLEIERTLRMALETDSLFFRLQPQYDISRNLYGFEALARLKDTNGSLIPPAEFIPIAEKAGLIDQIDYRVFRKAAVFFGKLIHETDTPLMLSTNISVKHLMKNSFIDEMREILRTSNVPAERLSIDITESIMIDSAEKAVKCINEVRKMGVRVVIDDFGTGYSSLGYLNNFPADMLKIDKSFIDVMNSSESSKKYVSMIISIGHILNLQVSAEGVETQDQLDTLREIGCDYIQGFVWGKPMDPSDAEDLANPSAV